MLSSELSIRLLRMKLNYWAPEVILILTSKSCVKNSDFTHFSANPRGYVPLTAVLSPNTKISDIENSRKQRCEVVFKTTRFGHQLRYENCLSLGYKFSAYIVDRPKALSTLKASVNQLSEPRLFWSLVANKAANALDFATYSEKPSKDVKMW